MPKQIKRIDQRTSGVAREPLKRLERGLPAHWYFDPAHYARELEAFWYSQWIAGPREEEIATPGAYQVMKIGIQSIIVVRGADRIIRAFHNTCRHRGSVLCTEAQGEFPGAQIACPYHAWTYDLAGRLVLTPRQMRTPDFDPRRFPLDEVPVQCWGGYAFVNLDRDKPPSLAGSLGPLANRFENYELGRLRLGYRIVIDVPANWKLLAENFSECFHCPRVHPELCRVIPAYRDAGAWGLHRDPRGRVVPERTPEFVSGARTLTLDGRARLPPLRKLDPVERKTLYVPAMHPPNLFLNLHPDYVHVHRMFPIGPESVRIVYDWLFAPEALGSKAFDRVHYTALWEITNRQDARNCALQQQGVHSRAFKHGWYVPQEFDCHRFARWVRAGLKRKPKNVDRMDA